MFCCCCCIANERNECSLEAEALTDEEIKVEVCTALVHENNQVRKLEYVMLPIALTLTPIP